MNEKVDEGTIVNQHMNILVYQYESAYLKCLFEKSLFCCGYFCAGSLTAHSLTAKIINSNRSLLIWGPTLRKNKKRLAKYSILRWVTTIWTKISSSDLVLQLLTCIFIFGASGVHLPNKNMRTSVLLVSPVHGCLSLFQTPTNIYIISLALSWTHPFAQACARSHTLAFTHTPSHWGWKAQCQLEQHEPGTHI